jgi:hypothetical protein
MANIPITRLRFLIAILSLFYTHYEPLIPEIHVTVVTQGPCLGGRQQVFLL